jgi:hypothetical protein
LRVIGIHTYIPQIWKTRNLTFKGKTLIVKNLLVSQIGYEIEMRGIPDRFKSEMNVVIYMGRQRKSNKVYRFVKPYEV